VYNHPALVDLPWYAIAGNHDYYGNVEAQIKLSERHSRWIFPELFHDHLFNWTETQVSSPTSITNTIDGISASGENRDGHSITRTYSVQLIMIDTAVLAGLVDRIDIPFMQPPGPSDPEVAQLWYDWLEEKLNQSTADYIWVAGHYPVFSVCWQGSSLEMIHRLKPLLDKYGAHYMVNPFPSFSFHPSSSLSTGWP
jgi:tartrate-resistant acid phosphatase type 5